MKPNFVLVFFVLRCVWQIEAAPLRNLDFEEYDEAALKLPGWHLTNANPRAIQNENNIGLGEMPDGVYASMYRPVQPSGGKYALVLHPFGDLFPWFLSQTGEIPADAKSMSFELRVAQVSLKFNNTEMPLVYRQQAGLEGWDFVDVSSFAGKTVTMEIKATGITGPQIPGGVTGLDNFRFSSDPAPLIPEPGTLTLSVFAALLALWQWRSSKKSS